jgi:hypothetical protein
MNRLIIRQLSFAALIVLLSSTISATGRAARPSGTIQHVSSSTSIVSAVQNMPVDLIPAGVSSYSLASPIVYWHTAAACTPATASDPEVISGIAAAGGLARQLFVRNDTRPPGVCNPYHVYSNIVADAGFIYWVDDSGLVRLSTAATPSDAPSLVSNQITGRAGSLPVELIQDHDNVFALTHDDASGVASPNATIWRVNKADGTTSIVFFFADYSVTSLSYDGEFFYWVDNGALIRFNQASQATKTLATGVSAYAAEGSRLDCSATPCITTKYVFIAQGHQVVRYSNSDESTSMPIYTSVNSAAQIYDLMSDGTSLFFFILHISPCAPSPCTSSYTDVLVHTDRMSESGGSAIYTLHGTTGSSETGAVGRELTSDGTFLFWRESDTAHHALKRFPVNPDQESHDLQAAAWEVTQGIQSLRNDVPLVADKPTYVRVYGCQIAGTRADTVEVALYGWRNGVPLANSPLQPSGVHRLETDQQCHFDRATKDEGWLFKLPDSWISAGTLTLKVVVDPRQMYLDPDRSNNTLPNVSFPLDTFTFTHKAPICLITIPVRTHAPPATPANPDFWRMADLMKRLMPVSDVWWFHQSNDVAQLEARFGIPPWRYEPYAIPEDDTQILTALEQRSFFTDDPDKCDNAGAITHYLGLVHADTPTYLQDGRTELGVARLNDDVLWVKFPRSAGSSDFDWYRQEFGTLAHELAHNYGRRHVNCPPGDPRNTDRGYPYSDKCKLDDHDLSDPATHFGFDINTRTPVLPDRTADFMSYKAPAWVSSYTWLALFNRINDAQMGQMGLPPPTAEATAQRIPTPNLAAASSVVFINGFLNPSQNRGGLNYGWVLPNAALGPRLLSKWQTLAAPASTSAALHLDPAGHAYHLRVLDDRAAVIDDRVITPEDPGEDSGSEIIPFSLTFPAPASAVSRLDLMDGNNVLASLQLGSNAPTVSVISPAGGEIIDDQMTISWRASDGDSTDKLLYTVQYSPDLGRTWHALITNYSDTSASDTVTLPMMSLGAIPGSTTGALIRVIASDGYHTTVATSQAFSLKNRPPEPVIVSPTSDQTVAPGQVVMLRGAASDAEDGALIGDALHWMLDGQPIGGGQEQPIDGLAPGTYDIALAAHDSSGQERTTHTTLRVGILSIPLLPEPALDGSCDDPSYDGTITLRLAPYVDGTQATAHLIRTNTDLWVCLAELSRGNGRAGASAGVHIDVDNSQDEQTQPSDLAFFVAEDGTPIGGGGGFLTSTSVVSGTWSAELRIPSSALGGWDHIVGIDLRHQGLGGQGDDNHWPFQADAARPSTWAHALLGSPPEIAYLSPDSATVEGVAFILGVNGSNFRDGAVVRWDGEVKPTTFISSTRLLAHIDAGALATSGIVTVTVTDPALNAFPSNAAIFTVRNPAPTITRVVSAGASTGGLMITINGTDFVNGATAMWNGIAVPTTFVSRTQLQASLSSTHLAGLHSADVAVVNPAPGGGVSNIVTFAITYRTYLPLVAYNPMPDLIGSISLSPNKRTFRAGEPVQITMVITNTGAADAGPFWAELSINQLVPPDSANKPWNQHCTLLPCFGIAWAVSEELAAGQTITLTSTIDSYAPDYTIWPGWFASGTTDLALYVDSWNPNSANGAVAESNESNNLSVLSGLSVSGPNPIQVSVKHAKEIPPRPVLGRMQ